MNQHSCAWLDRPPCTIYLVRMIYILQLLSTYNALRLVVALLAATLGCAAAQAATAPTEPVFGPKVYTRSRNFSS